MMEKLREWNYLICNKWKLLVTFEHGTYPHFIQSIGYSSCFQVDPLSWVMSLLWVFQRMHCMLLHYVLVSAWFSQCCQVFCHVTWCSKGSWKFTFAIKTTFVLVPFESVLWLWCSQHSRTLFWVSCRRCGIHHGLSSMRLFLSTSDHHLRISPRNKNIVHWDLYTLMKYSLTLGIGSHHRPWIKIFNWLFDTK